MLSSSHPPVTNQLKKYTVLEEIASGQFGKVHLALYKGKIYALKQTQIVSANECLIHQAMDHPNIVRLHESFQVDGLHYLIMEHAAGGELFDKIQPDVGIDEELAHFYFRQLLAGVEYLHKQGVSHRDLKPENLLLDECGNLKICDFGLSTVFRHKGNKRRLSTVCGTRPYVAPEIIFGDYDGEMVDIWSCGVILFVLLVGNTPWDEPTDQSPEFCAYVMDPDLTMKSPWNRFRSNVYNLIRGMCQIYEEQRFSIDQIKKNDWFRQRTSLLSSSAYDSSFPLDRLLSQMNMDESDYFASQMDNIMMSQQQSHTQFKQSYEESADTFAFSQPVEYIGTHGYQTHVNFSQPDKNNRSNAISITRFYTQKQNILNDIAQILTDFLVSYNQSEDSIQFSTVDKRKCPLNGEIRMQKAVDTMWMIHFRRVKGDPLEFRRFYIAIRDQLADYICHNQGE